MVLVMFDVKFWFVMVWSSEKREEVNADIARAPHRINNDLRRLFHEFTVITGRVTNPKVWQKCLYICIGANSEKFAITGEFVTSVRNFSESHEFTVLVMFAIKFWFVMVWSPKKKEEVNADVARAPHRIDNDLRRLFHEFTVITGRVTDPKELLRKPKPWMHDGRGFTGLSCMILMQSYLAVYSNDSKTSILLIA
ncbi:Major facilitator superfamily protein [Perilla frutescens var. hirtella]|uniref:Major facilitator superfamily protein n=1 Tax=Perilla frutescens var. hirtella TaxID=608512 RepID=A0AAD4P6J5_PERFH|nr:Major facilitator superfamily protein [Perilla frutescens var. hirtella]